MNALQALILGLVQGLAEFLPISSSGHLKLAEHFLGLKVGDLVAFDVLLHVGTLVAMLIYFRDDLSRIFRAFFRSLRTVCSKGGWAKLDGDPAAKWAWLVVLTLIPTGVVALSLKDWLEAFSSQITVVAMLLLITGCVNAFSHRRTLDTGRERRPIEALTPVQGLLCGLAQSVALLNGISRSGSTIAAGLACGLDNDAAPRFAFLMAVPAIAGAAIVALPDWGKGDPIGWFPALVGFVAAAVSGYWALCTVFKVVKETKLSGFAWYCWGLGSLALVLSLLGH